MQEKPEKSHGNELPSCVTEFIRTVTRKMRYRRKVRQDVQAELTAHFEDELRGCENPQEREQKALRLIEEFGDAGLLGVLCRRAKKRCRPLWRKALVRGGAALGIFALYLLACSLPLLIGKPTIRVDYVDWLNERWRPAQPDAENAREYYDRAARLYVEPSEILKAKRESPEWAVRDCNEVDLRLLAGWLSENKPSFDMLRKGASTANYWPVYDVNEADRNRSGTQALWTQAKIMQSAMESLAPYRSLAQALRDWAGYQARLGVVEDAMSDSLAIVRFGLHLKDKGLLVEQLVGIAIEALGHSALYGVLERPGIPPESLIRVQQDLMSMFRREPGGIDLDGEMSFWYDNIQRSFTDNGRGGGRALRDGILFAGGDWRRNLVGLLLFDYPDRREAIAMVDTYFEGARETLRTPPHRSGLGSKQEQQMGVAKGNLLLSLLTPAYEGLAQLIWRSRTDETALVATVAIFRYKAEKGSYPERLEELVSAGVLASLPDDPFGQGSLTYRRTADGFLLYSWGQNLIDDGGRQGTGQDGEPRMWAGNGDCVFWPVGP